MVHRGRPPLGRDNRRRPGPEDDLILLDDYLLRETLLGEAPPELAALSALDVVATTNLFYARLCRAVVLPRPIGRLAGDLPDEAREALAAVVERLPDRVLVEPMRELAWHMGRLAAEFRGLSLLGAEAVAAAAHLSATICVRDRNDGPGIRAAAEALGVPYVTIGG